MEHPTCFVEGMKQFVVLDAPPTVRYIPDFISEEEEAYLLQQVYKSPKTKWTQLSGRRLQNWGGLPHPKGMLPEKIPDWLQTYCEKISSLGAFSGKTANHVLVNEYKAGEGIMPHEDGPLYHPTVTTISLGSHTLLDFYRPVGSLEGDAPETEENRYLLSLLVKPRSLLILQDDMYERLLHGIQGCIQDTLTDKVVNLPAAGALPGETLTRGTRVSLTEDTKKMEPQVKRQKVSVCDTDSWTAYPILSDEQSQDVELMEAFAAPIVDKKKTAQLVKELNSLYPLSGLQHIKRVRACKDKGSRHPLEVLVCLVSDAPDMKVVSIDSLLPSEGLRHDGLGEPFVVKVPSRPPLTRPQFELASKHWPTSFHEDKQVTIALRGELFNPHQKALMHMYMISAVTAARAGKEMGMEAVGAVVVNPATQTVIAVGHDCRGDHPLHHAVMVCIDLVAQSQGAGCYSFDKYPACSFSSPTSDTCPNEPDAEASSQPYICTGYDLYVTREPCVMCAMALVHSRIGRVFYGTVSADGALGTKFKIHSQKDLNHRFAVYKGVLSMQCDDLDRLDDHIQKQS